MISDDLPLTVCLVRALGLEHRCTVHDLYDEAAPLDQSDLIGSDVARLTSEAIVRLQRLLGPQRATGARLSLLAKESQVPLRRF